MPLSCSAHSDWARTYLPMAHEGNITHRSVRAACVEPDVKCTRWFGQSWCCAKQRLVLPGLIMGQNWSTDISRGRPLCTHVYNYIVSTLSQLWREFIILRAELPNNLTESPIYISNCVVIRHKWSSKIFSILSKEIYILANPLTVQQTRQFANIHVINRRSSRSGASVKFAGYRKAIFENGSLPSSRR